MRVVVDPNVLASALISTTGAPAAVIAGWGAREFELVVSKLLIAELRRTLSYPRVRSRIDDERAAGLLQRLAGAATPIDDPGDRPSNLTPDPDDDYLVALARAAGANFIVSGDRHLLELRQPDPPVLTPREFLDLLSRGPDESER